MDMYAKCAIALSVTGMLVVGGPAKAGQFTDITSHLTELNEGYVRDGFFISPRDLQEVFDGSGEMTRVEVLNILGSPNDVSNAQGVLLYNINLPLYDNDYLVCQYRASFTQQVLTSSEWRRPQCNAVFEELLAAYQPQELSFSADLVFGFDSYEIPSEKQREIQQVVREEWPQVLAADDAPTVLVTGYTDHIGAPEYNIQLSERRAEAVANVLVREGVNPEHIRYEGRGDRNPVVTAECIGRSGDALKECLAPNRRVEISLEERTVSVSEATF